MFDKLKCIFSLVLALLVVTNCEKKSEGIVTFYTDQDRINQWLSYLDDLEYERKNNKIVVLFARSADCNKYENEIKWWDQNLSKIDEIDIALIMALC